MIGNRTGNQREAFCAELICFVRLLNAPAGVLIESASRKCRPSAWRMRQVVMSGATPV